MGRLRDRTFTGCWKCRSRKVKCDETKPACLNCQRVGVDCTGYGARLTWVRGDDDVPVRPTGRRAICCASTWKGVEVIPSEIVDLLILQCDDPTGGDPSLDGCFSSLPDSHNPFSMFPIVADGKSTTKHDQPDVEAPDTGECVPGQIQTLLDPFSGRTRLERYLFHHYVTHVAVIMMPYEHPNNPWTNFYPAAAVQLRAGEFDALYSAMLAQAAFNLGQRGVRQNESRRDMFESASEYYGDAMRTLLSAIGGSGVESHLGIATIMTLMMAEIYSGRSGQWRHHLRGAWDLLLQHGPVGPQTSILTRLSITSLRIIKVIGDTSSSTVASSGEEGPPPSTGVVATRPRLRGSATAMTEFLFTIGVPQDVLDCISQITSFRNKTPEMRMPGEAEDLMETVLACLRRYRPQESSGNPSGVYFTALESGEELLQLGDEAWDEKSVRSPDSQGRISMAAEVRLQMHAFVRAVYIYLYRSVTNAPPRAVQHHVTGVFSAVSSFLDTYSGAGRFPGNFSLWPAFVAAAEATRDEDVDAARRWMEWALTFGIGVRTKVKTVIDEVWRRRDDMAAATGLDKDLIVVDWFEVMRELDCDVLLI